MENLSLQLERGHQHQYNWKISWGNTTKYKYYGHESFYINWHFAIIVVRTFSQEILVLGLSHHLMTTTNSTISEPYKHLTIAKAYIARQIAPWRKRHIWVWSVSDVSFRIRVRAALPCWLPWSTYPKTVEIICPKWNAYSGPRLLTAKVIKHPLPPEMGID